MNLDNNLIKICVCGNTEHFIQREINQIPVLECQTCGTVHQHIANWTQTDLINFYSNEYHEQFQKKKGVVSYHDRYTHDCKVADLRLMAYKNFLQPSSRGLDVGSSNSAFVHRAREQGFDCWGLEPGAGIGDQSYTIRSSLESLGNEHGQFDWTTLHDSIEHMTDVVTALAKIRALLKPEGRAIIDLPDFWQPQGRHHWKLIEHLWFFTERQFFELLDSKGFITEKVTRPVPGKLVFYAVKR